MRLHFGLSLLILVSLLASVASAQTAADITSEPHHHLLLKNDQVRVFLVTLERTEEAFVRHEHNFLWVTLDDSELVIWGEGASPIQHFLLPRGDVRFYMGGRSFGLRNDRVVDYHGVMVEFLNPKVNSYGFQYQSGGWDFGSGAMNPPVDPHAKFMDRLELGAASVVDMQLLAGDSFPAPEKPAAELVIPVTDVDLKSGESERIRKSPGDVAWTSAGRKAAFLNASNQPVRFVVVELPLDTK